MTRVALLWHFHQPDYRDPQTGIPVMPWTRLHALRGYRDLLVEAVEYDVSMTINVVPSLLDQLLHYANGGSDTHLDLTRRDAASLSPEEAEQVVQALPTGNLAMTEAWPDYARLRRRLRRGAPYSVQDLLDVQVWGTLAWFGATARRDFLVLRELSDKGQGFSEADKAAMLAVQDTIVRALPDRLGMVMAARGPALSTSPYFHPILPLLVDVRHARRNLPHLPDDLRFAYPEDARRQLTMARERLTELTGAPPAGLWPSEGSVSPEVVGLAGEVGFRWLVTDQGVLERSERQGHSDQKGGWDLGNGMTGFFRNTHLSDGIGFRYAHMDPHEAVAQFLAGVRNEGPGVVTVALDGENPWETYTDAGRAFRARLYEALEGDIRAVTFDEAHAEPPVGTVSRIHTGSWIGANFQIWIGHPTDREAFGALAAARDAAEQAPEALREAAMQHLLPAEGSDWNWWYGDEFHTEYNPAFDALYRSHLRAAWRALGQEPPESLDRPLGRSGAPTDRSPLGFIDVTWDNAFSTFAWRRSGALRSWGGTMAQGAAVTELRYGWTVDGALWVRVSAGPDLRLSAPDDPEVRVQDGITVARFDGGAPRPFQWAGPDGVRWPAEPITLALPAHPTLSWWDV
ncbi:MAG: glycoside hydrolase family 57 protein [Myxococcota bacterium]